MFLIVGLGNPGKEYEKTRHNVGFMALDELAKTNGFPPFKLSKRHSALISEGILNSVKVSLIKPQTFMNNSGGAVKSLLPKPGLGRRPKPGLGLVVIHDDIDILIGKVKISKESRSAGHKGVESIIRALKTKSFTRIRVGIQPETGKPENVEDFVLQCFLKKEGVLLSQGIQKTMDALSALSPNKNSYGFVNQAG